VDVRLLVPGSSNWPLVGALSKSAYRPLLQAGVRVFEWNGPMLHAKTAVADGCWTRIGSSNSNLASWVSNRELDVTVKDKDLAAQMQAMYEDDIKNSTEVVLAPGRTGIQKPVASGAQSYERPSLASGRRLFSGAIGLGSTLTASFTHRRQLQPGESLVVLGGGIALVLLGAIALLLPHIIAWLIALPALWSGAALLVSSLKLRRAGKSP
jgi:cardiolipin synthase